MAEEQVQAAAADAEAEERSQAALAAAKGTPEDESGWDTVEELADSLGADPNDTGFAFPILADPELEVFRRYRAHDDFEGMPLHGTFLIDADGRVRWQDISYEPFMDPEFLLAESERLLGLPDRDSEATSTGNGSAGSGGR